MFKGYDGQRPDHEYEDAELQFDPDDDPEPEAGEYPSDSYEEDGMDDDELLSHFD